MHLVIDGYGGDVEKMWDQQLVRDFLDQFPSKLAMTPITEPQVLKYTGDNVEDAGVSGFVIIAESHISIHTFPYRQYVNIDIFSCKPFDDQRAAGAFRCSHRASCRPVVLLSSLVGLLSIKIRPGVRLCRNISDDILYAGFCQGVS